MPPSGVVIAATRPTPAQPAQALMLASAGSALPELVVRGGNGRPVHMWVGLAPDDRLASLIDEQVARERDSPATVLVVHGHGVGGGRLTSGGRMKEAVAWAKEQDVVEAVLLACKQSSAAAFESTHQLATWATSDALFVREADGAVFAGHAVVMADGRLRVFRMNDLGLTRPVPGRMPVEGLSSRPPLRLVKAEPGTVIGGRWQMRGIGRPITAAVGGAPSVDVSWLDGLLSSIGDRPWVTPTEPSRRVDRLLDLAGRPVADDGGEAVVGGVGELVGEILAGLQAGLTESGVTDFAAQSAEIAALMSQAFGLLGLLPMTADSDPAAQRDLLVARAAGLLIAERLHASDTAAPALAAALGDRLREGFSPRSYGHPPPPRTVGVGEQILADPKIDTTTTTPSSHLALTISGGVRVDRLHPYLSARPRHQNARMAKGCRRGPSGKGHPPAGDSWISRGDGSDCGRADGFTRGRAILNRSALRSHGWGDVDSLHGQSAWASHRWAKSYRGRCCSQPVPTPGCWPRCSRRRRILAVARRTCGRNWQQRERRGCGRRSTAR